MSRKRQFSAVANELTAPAMSADDQPTGQLQEVTQIQDASVNDVASAAPTQAAVTPQIANPLSAAAAVSSVQSPVCSPPVSSAAASAGAVAVASVPQVAGAAAVLPVSPGRNRQLFLATITPQHMTCDLSKALVGAGIKYNIQAIVVATFPVQKGPPARRHVFVADQWGCTGVTVWNGEVAKFTHAVLGAVVTITRASVALYQGKKGLVVNKESSLLVDSVNPSPMAEWWTSLTRQAPLSLSAALMVADNAIINVFGILAFISHEEKEVNGEVKIVSSIHLASPTAKFQLRGWDLQQETIHGFSHMMNSVICARRVRVTSYAETKIAEIMDSALGTIVSPHADAELDRFWAE